MAGEPTAWATIADVSAITGTPVDEITDDEIVRAQFIIDIVTGRTIDHYELLVANQRTRDLKWLMQAVAFQTVWMKAQPDFYERFDLESFNQDGVSGGLKGSALWLSPLAKIAIKRLSWKGSRSVRLGLRRREWDLARPAGAPAIDTPGEEWTDL